MRALIPQVGAQNSNIVPKYLRVSRMSMTMTSQLLRNVYSDICYPTFASDVTTAAGLKWIYIILN